MVKTFQFRTWTFDFEDHVLTLMNTFENTFQIPERLVAAFTLGGGQLNKMVPAVKPTRPGTKQALIILTI